ncbi:hypothetical protein PPTG_01373 [Phytophthora nicotianae INRA-310]|uniref:Uncharacterized protein n=4 Tax=Phytophthora nicotianae TaxID=4792 RepID=W2R936_PHYN3|nr:hypothetical protein PPTG_01373 [Phytophthora nicotianae INRA-310]ETN21040.1 hypothetical protein PPTG_01373 [Phytophthora nicotianae INRA-310]
MSESESNSDQSASDSEVAGDSSTAWKFIDEPSPQLHVEDVEEFLLSKARTEANRVAKKLLVRIFGTEHRLPSDVTTQDIMKAWLDPSFLAVAQRHVNSSLAQSAFVSRSDLLKFLQVELWLAFYSVSPSNFYERSNKQYYPPVKSVMPSKRYFAILRAFGKPNAEDDVSSTHWKAPFQHDPNLSHAMDELCRLCSRFGFVSEVSIASLDDDLLRLRSSAVDDLGLNRTRNPKKGYGPVQHGIVSLATGLFLGGHIASKGETVVDVVKILQRGLCGATTDSQIRLPGIMFALDRGYQSKEVNKQILECGAAIIGTHKKNSSFPFTFGAAPKNTKNLSVSKVQNMHIGQYLNLCSGVQLNRINLHTLWRTDQVSEM